MSEQDNTTSPAEAGTPAGRPGPSSGLVAVLVIAAVVLVGWRMNQARHQAGAVEADQPAGEAGAMGMGGGGGGGGGWTPPTAEERAQRFDKLCEDLGVDETQKAEIQKLYDAYTEQTQALRENEDLDRDARRAEMRKLREERTAKVKALLTEEQQAKYDELTARRGGGGPGGGGPGGGGPGMGGGPGGGGPGAERGPRPEGGAPGGDGTAPAGEAPAAEAPAGPAQN